MRRRRDPQVVEGSYEPATLDVAWSEFQVAHPGQSPASYAVFRAGYRRGFGQGSLASSTTFVHTFEDDQEQGGGRHGDEDPR